MPWDDPLGPLEEIVTACGDLGQTVGFTVHRAVVELPVELQTRPSDGGVVIDTAPVRQAVETTVMPVLHRLRIAVEVSRAR